MSETTRVQHYYVISQWYSNSDTVTVDIVTTLSCTRRLQEAHWFQYLGYTALICEFSRPENLSCCSSAAWKIPEMYSLNLAKPELAKLKLYTSQARRKIRRQLTGLLIIHDHIWRPAVQKTDYFENIFPASYMWVFYIICLLVSAT